MKESILIEMRNKVDALTRVIQQIIYDINETKDLSRGTLEVLKKIPGYKKAVDELKTEIEKVIEESHFSAFRDSAIVTFLNPKSYGFFVVFVPQFIDSSSPILPQFIIMIVTFVGLGVVNTLAFAMLAAQIRHMITKPDTLV